MYGMPSFDTREYTKLTRVQLETTFESLADSYLESRLVFIEAETEMIKRMSELNTNKLRERLVEIQRRLRLKGVEIELPL